MDVLLIALVAFAEAIVHLLRYRSAHSPSWVWSSVTTMLICITRLCFVGVGARAAITGGGEDFLVAGLVYVSIATATNAWLHRWLESRKKKVVA